MTTVVTVDENERLIDVLCSSLYPGASRQSAGLVLGYCQAAGIDPMLKPVHIVPMRVKTGAKNSFGKDEMTMRDCIMPGIGLYRIQAARTGQYAGQDLPEFGPTRTLTYTAKQTEWVDRKPRDTYVEKVLEYPEWCAVTIYRLVGGFRVPFTAVEFWAENYATAGRDSDAPNEMWARRTRGQLAKCAEAQVLRKAFPEVGAAPTADEMEGRPGYVAEADDVPEPVDVVPAKPKRASAKTAEPPPPALPDESKDEPFVPAVVVPPAEPVQTPVEQVAAPEPAAAPPAEPAAPPAAPPADPASDGERKNVLITAKVKNIDLGALLASLGVALDPATLSGLSKTQFKLIKGKL